MSQTCATCGTAFDAERFASCPVCFLEAELPPLAIGEHLQLVEEVGRGGMGVVYRARDRFLDREVAVKLLRDDFADNESLRERFEREAKAMARLEHTNIVSVFGAGRDDLHSWIAMEWIDGPRLLDSLPLGIERALEITRDVAAGLAHAHAKGIVHRDVKPENVLIDSDGRARLADFGLAAIADPVETRLTRTGHAVGTPAYFAPEVLEGKAADARSDVYAAGVLLYQLATGNLPMGAFEPLGNELDAVLEKALARDPEQRFASAIEFEAALREPGAVRSTGTPSSQEERLWTRAVAIVDSVATAATLWAGLRSVTPRVVEESEPTPLIVIRSEVEGQIIERARFETWPTLAAFALVAVAACGHAALYAYWRRERRFEVSPERPLPQSKWLLLIALAGLVLYGARLWGVSAGWEWAVGIVPVLGGSLELFAVFVFWLAFLESVRTRRPLRRETRLGLGVLLCLVPPVVELVRFLSSWTP